MAAIAATMSAPMTMRASAVARKPTRAAVTPARSQMAKVTKVQIANASQFAGRTASLKASRTVCRAASRKSLETKAFKVAVLGAAGGIGQSLSLLVSMNPMVTELALYDIANTPGVAADLSHINTPAQVKGYLPESIAEALTGCDLVIIPAGVPRKPGMSRDDLFGINAGIVAGLVESCAKYCPKAVLNIISNPVNSTVPIACEIQKKMGVYDPKKVMGVTSLDIVRSNTFVAEMKGLDLKDVDVPVIGGHAGITILPLLSQATPSVSFDDDVLDKLTVRIQNAGTEVVEAKAGAGSATLSMAYAGARMADSVLKGLSGEDGIFECTYVASDITELPYFSTKVKLGKEGVEQIMPIGDITPYEAEWLAKLKVELTGSIEKGIKFAADYESK